MVNRDTLRNLFPTLFSSPYPFINRMNNLDFSFFFRQGPLATAISHRDSSGTSLRNISVPAGMDTRPSESADPEGGI